MIKICVWTCDMNLSLGSVLPLAMFFSRAVFYMWSNWDLIFQFSDFRTGTPATPRTPRPAFNRFWDQEILSLNSSCPTPTWRNPPLLTVQPNSANSNPSLCCWVFNCQVFLVIIIITEIHSFLSENHWSFLLPILFGIDLSWNDLPFSKGFMAIGWPESPPPKKLLIL